MAEVIIHDGNWQDFVSPVVNGETKSHGLIPRDFKAVPVGHFASVPPFNLPLIPESEWQSRLDAQKASKSRLSDIRNIGKGGAPIPSTDQDGVGYCWCHSGTSAHLICRAKMNEPWIDLSAFSIGCMVKGFRDEGGNGIEGVQFQAERGIATSEFWPQRSMSRSNDKPETWQNAARHKYITWLDLDPRNMKAQLVTCLLLGFPVVVDYDWWSHSVCAIDLESLSPFSVRIWNSWGDSWSENGTGLLQGNKAMPDNAVAAIVTAASPS